MNDYQDDYLTNNDLEKEIMRLKEENQFLREEVRRLNQKLPSLNSTTPQSSVNSPLVDYYLNRYSEIHKYILDKRTSTIDEELASCEQEYSSLTDHENMLEEIAKNNQNINSRINEIDQIIAQNTKEYNQKSEDFKKVASEVTNLEDNIYYTNIDYYNNLLSKLSIGDTNETISYMNFVSDVLEYTLYLEVIKYLDSAKEALKKLEDLNQLEIEIKKQNEALLIEKDSLAKQIEIISFEENEKKLDALVYEITSKKKAKEELLELFANLKKEHEKNIKDEIKHLQILEYTNQQIALKMDEMILDYKNNLAVADTASNLLREKQLRLAKLNEQMEQIMPHKEKYDTLNSEYNELQAMYKTISNNVDEIENFISEAKKIMSSNQKWAKTLSDYSNAKFKLTSIKQTIDSLLIKEKNLAETRKQVLNDPYGKTDLIRLNDELKVLQADIDTYNNEAKNLENLIYQLKQNEYDYKIISIYEENLICENKLPPLYDKQRALSALISDKYIEVSSAKMKCSNYDTLQKEIEELENEIANF